ncbi:MAG: VWA domain-containing protein [Pyrinomonadaceae bacterium]
MRITAVACLAAALLCCFMIDSPIIGHGQTPQVVQDQPDVVRTYTEIVQTDVMVFDKQGHFVDGLKNSDFELRIDGSLKPVEFFEKVTAGSITEEMQIAAARGRSAGATSANVTGPAPLDRGRPIFFYVDDLHLDLSAWQATRKLITRFIDNEMGQNDEAAITSASGQIGFLQQLTDNKAVLRLALERLKPKPYTVRDLDRPAMTEYQALLITNYDRDITDFFVSAMMRLYPGMQRETAASIINGRARSMAQQSGVVTANTLIGLEGLIRSANKLPGRKLVFFVSGGFFLDNRNSDSSIRLQRITSAAARSGVVIYSMDARGLVATIGDISTEVEFDISGRLQRANSGELHASQDSLNALAVDTGGKAFRNTNSLEPGLARALKETSAYYLLAWKPDRESRQSKFRRIEVKVVGRPDLTVQVRRGFFDREPEPNKTAKVEKTAKEKKPGEAATSPEAELRKEMAAPYPDRDIPISLSLTYQNNPPKGLMLSTAMEVSNEFLSFVPTNDKHTAVVTVAGTVFDDKGNAGAAFSNRITIEAPSLEAIKDGGNLTYGYPVLIKPGLYQVRVGVRDERTGRSGTKHGWIEIPDLSSGQLALSSLLLGARMPTAATANASVVADNLPETVALSIDHNFAHDGFLRFLLIAYNAALAPADSKPDIAIQVQIVRDEQPVTTTALKKISLDGVPDLTRIPYAAEVSLNGLPVGRYLLQVTVVDRVSKKSASQQSRFEIN